MCFIRLITADVARSVRGLSVCLSVSAKTAEPFELRWRLRAELGGPKEPCIRWDQDRTEPFAAVRGDKSTMRPFVKLLWALVIVIVSSRGSSSSIFIAVAVAYFA